MKVGKTKLTMLVVFVLICSVLIVTAALNRVQTADASNKIQVTPAQTLTESSYADDEYDDEDEDYDEDENDQDIAGEEDIDGDGDGDYVYTEEPGDEPNDTEGSIEEDANDVNEDDANSYPEDEDEY